MKITLSDKIIAWLALFSGLTISAVAIWYSVAGLVSIFAAAMIPIIVMGVVLEVSKLIATVWLKINWNRAPVFIRTYLLIAIAILMLITSMGIFGFLSKAHSDAGLVSGDVQAKIAVYDEKIKTERENIDAARKALTQMDAQVNERLSRSTDDRGAERAVQIRRQQQAERTRLQNDISRSQSAIAKLNEDRAPVAAEVRKVEAEVGPIKYIANFIYGDNPDANILEKAVTWVIIIIVSVFDPLAVILLLASQYSFQWFRKAQEEEESDLKEVKEWFDQGRERARQLDEEAAEQEATSKVEPFYPTASALWPFPVQEPTWKMTTIETTPVVEDLDDHGKIDDSEKEEQEILNQAQASEKEGMSAWKAANPDSSLKLQRRLFERGIISKLPWDDYLKPQADFTDDAAKEAQKWAEENSNTVEAISANEWAEEKISNSENTIAYMENVDGNQVKKVLEGYQQNAEQNEGTLWQRVKKAKNE